MDKIIFKLISGVLYVWLWNPGDPCRMKNSSSCILGIQSLVETSFQFKDCLCTDDFYCTVNKLLGKKCINESGNILLYGIFKVMKKKSTILKLIASNKFYELLNNLIVFKQLKILWVVHLNICKTYFCNYTKVLTSSFTSNLLPPYKQ